MYFWFLYPGYYCLELPIPARAGQSDRAGQPAKTFQSGHARQASQRRPASQLATASVMPDLQSLKTARVLTCIF